MNLLSISGMTKVHTDRKLFDKSDFSLEEGDKVGIVGINGTGKSTLLRILAGLESMDEGIYTKGNQIVVKFLPQSPEFPEGISIYDYVIEANKTEDNMWNLEGEAKSILNQLGFDSYTDLVDKLSGGEKKRVALAASLLTSCDILILDEPTNHLDSEMADWLESYLKARRGALVMVTHDRYFLDQVCNRIIEIDKGKLFTYVGNYAKYLELKAQREEMEQATERKRQSLFRVELEWMMRGARARSTKQKARIERFEELKDRKKPIGDESVAMSSIGSRLGKKTLEVYGVGKSYGERKLFSDFEYIFLRNDRVGIVGHNGCGKSTFLNIITGIEEPDVGHIEIGETVKIGYFSQENEYMDDSLKVIDYIREVGEYIETSDGKITASKMLERFLFDGTMQYQLISKLSGGEKRRLYLLRILMASPNILILDEPTNDLDIATLNVLEGYLDEFQGIVITVSHDRYFLDRTVQRIFAFEENQMVQYEGNFTDYQNAAIDKGSYARLRKEKVSTPKLDKDTWKQENKKPKKLKFSFNEQREFDNIDSDIALLEEKLERKETEIIESSTDFAKLRTLMEEKEELESQLEYKMERWVVLQELNERIQSSTEL
ncbi:MAG: ABC-F family ATP-binding cassette domain-containing protein [Eubacteriales bacterium]